MTMRKTRVGDVEEEVAGYMPQAFVMMYYGLVAEGLKDGVVDSVEKSRNGLGVTRGAPPGSEGAVLLSEGALARKRVIDRKLREIARMDLSDVKKAPPKCSSCGVFGNDRWRYCAGCGAVWRREGEGTAPIGGKVKLEKGLPSREPLKGVVRDKGSGAGTEKKGQRWVQLR